MPPAMTREQADRFAALLLGPPRALPSDIVIHHDGEPELLKPTEPACLRSAPSRRLTTTTDRTPAPSDQVHTRHTIPESVRSEVLSRDGQWCYLCDSSVLLDGLHFDHIIPVSRGGTNDPSNVAVSCAACNLAKGAGLTDKRPRALR